MVKLFYCKTDIVFASDGKRPDKDARLFLREQTDGVVLKTIQIESLQQFKDLNPSPEWLESAYVWGIEKDTTVKEFLNKDNEEYKLYLKLKAKFGD